MRAQDNQVTVVLLRHLNDNFRSLAMHHQPLHLNQRTFSGHFTQGIVRFQQEYLGWRSERIEAYFVKELLVVRILGVLTLAERQLGKTSSPEKGRDLIKQVRKQLLELARPMLESLVHEVTGVKVSSVAHDISTVTGEELVVFTLATVPRFG